MPTLDWIGKPAVVNHHRKVPYHLLRCDREFSAGDPDAGNLLIQGDNLLALKALLPYYAGKVKCIYIDPPYNTGNEGWAYNDNVRDPRIQRWLNEVVDTDKLDRHDRWLCMMYPRVAMLRRFLSRDGIIAVSIDDNELVNCGMLMDMVFGPSNRLAVAPWLAEPSGGKQKTSLRRGHEYILIYHNGDDSQLTREEKSSGKLDQRDKFGAFRKGRELLKWGEQSLREDRPNMWFALRNPGGEDIYPYRGDGREGRWRIGKDNPLTKLIAEDSEHAWWELRPFDAGVSVAGKTERWVPYEKIRDAKRSFGWTTWLDSFGFNADATRELKDIFGSKPFDTPKPTQLIRWLITLHSDVDAIVLDSFAGSGTTGHAVLAQNKADGGNRRFICIEMDDTICGDVTALRLSKVIKGYDNAKGESMEGLGGGYRFCKLDKPLFDEAGNIGEEVTFSDLAAHVFFTETGSPIPKRPKKNNPLLGVHQGKAVYLLFNGVLGDKRPDRGNVLTHGVAQDLPTHPEGVTLGGRVVYGEACRLGAKSLASYGITFKQVPYELKVD